MARRVLVTGADGFIGSHLVEALVRRGDSVRALAMYNSFGWRGWLDSLPQDIVAELDIRAGDIRDARSVGDAMKDVEAVFHLAALIAIPYSYQAPASYVETNITGTLNVLEVARATGVETVVHTSTSEVYGTAEYVPIDEGHRLHAQSPYAATKIAADQLALSYHASFGTPVAVIRPFNTYGPRQSTRAVIPTVITQIAAGARQIRLGALSPTRDFNFVMDTVGGFIAVGDSARAIGRVVNIGSGFEVSIGATAGLIAEEMGGEVEIVADRQRTRPERSEVNRLLADNRLAHELVGWEPRFAGIEGFRRGLRETIEWYTDPRNLRQFRPNDYVV